MFTVSEEEVFVGLYPLFQALLSEKQGASLQILLLCCLQTKINFEKEMLGLTIGKLFPDLCWKIVKLIAGGEMGGLILRDI